MSGWQVRKLKEVCENVTVGFVGTMAEHYRPAGVLFLRSLNIKPFKLSFDDIRYIDESFHQKIKKSSLRPGDVAVVRTGYPGTACVIPTSLPLSNCSDLVIVRPGPDLNPHYLAAIFNSAFGRELVAGNLVGAAQQHFNVTVAKELKLLIPPRQEQDKIAAILSAYEDLIANNQRRITLLERMAEDIYREWFVRLRFPGYEQVKFEKGVPQGWRFAELGELATINSSSLKKGSQQDRIQYIDISAVTTNHIGDLSEIALADAPGRARRLVKHGDVIWSSVRPASRAYCLIYEPPKNLVASTGFAVISPKPGIAFTFINFAVTSDSFVEQMAMVAKGSAYPATSFDDFGKAKVLRPSADLLDRFHALCEPMFRRRHQLRETNKALAKQRDALLPRLISGKLAVDALDINPVPQ
jgi:type I restriction enzyme, S subunit